jgi:thiol-disulfide isomerase/thioredoxin
MKIKKQLNNYLAKKSKISIALDIVFALLLISLVFPTTRMAVVSTIQRITLFAPSPEEAENRIEVSEDAFQWSFRTAEGESIALEDFRGEVVFLNMWATWCPPCVAEMPAIQKLYNQYGDQVEFLLVSNEKAEVVNAFMNKRDFDMPVYLNSHRPPEVFNASTIPTTYILTKEGAIAMEKEGAARWNSNKVKNLLDDLIAR